ncbi:hypothetical protein LJB42_003456 [Komagataella kurtzmanii]|nr:hypothetical protein LJB42_003456 [Komagataella kurtzmanii]
MLSKLAQTELISLAKAFIPPLLPTFHKGQTGKVAIIGGCEDYTGAPFFSAHAAATLGIDLTHVVCEYNAGTVIKSYSPNLMVHPYLYETDNVPSQFSNNQERFLKDKVFPKIYSLLSRIDVAVLGPGFGRNPLMLKQLESIIDKLKETNKFFVLDADSLWLVTQNPDIVRNYEKAILTPNIVELSRLCKKLNIDFDITKNLTLEESLEIAKKLSKELNVAVIVKGHDDLIINRDDHIVSSAEGSLKRVGGQGDSLSGLIGGFLAWANAYQNSLWKVQDDPKLTTSQLILLSAFAGSLLTRTSAHKAFDLKQRSMQTTDLHDHIAKSFTEIFES